MRLKGEKEGRGRLHTRSLWGVVVVPLRFVMRCDAMDLDYIASGTARCWSESKMVIRMFTGLVRKKRLSVY